ncbi:MAG: hypothetical protein EA382_17975, partial [Spirochaetaceae bacterium]
MVHAPEAVTLAQTLCDLGESDSSDLNKDRWDESMRSMPARIPFLDPTEISFARNLCGLDAGTDDLLIHCADRIASNRPLARLAWHATRCLYDYPEPTDFTRWPRLQSVAGARAASASAHAMVQNEPGAWLLIIALSMVRRVIATHERLGVSADVTAQTCRQITCFAGNYSTGTRGGVGIYAKQMFWLRHYTEGRLFRLGRFEFMLKQLHDAIVLFRHRRTGYYLALAADGGRYDRDGYAVSDSKADAGASDAFTAKLVLDQGSATGHPIDPAGVVLRDPVQVDYSDWERTLASGDTVIDLHIPADGRMDPDACVESMRRAVDFFAHHFPERQARSFWCSSWIFGPQLERILSERSNLVRYLKQCYLLPVPSTGGSLWFVYLDDHVDPSAAPRENSLQAAVSDFLAAGGRWRDAGMVFPVDRLDGFGSEPFRSSWS